MGTLIIPELSSSDIVRFWKKVNKDGDCWEWTTSVDLRGYGLFSIQDDSIGKHRLHRAHRVSYFLATGINPDSLNVCHSCDNPRCVKPAHLWLGTLRDNSIDCWKKGRSKLPRHEIIGTAKQCGENNLQAKLTADIIREIRVRRANKEDLNTIAKDYNISPGTVSKIALRTRWKHVL